jgi:hypothetical protein
LKLKFDAGLVGVYAPSIYVPAIVDMSLRDIRSPAGQFVTTRAYIMLLEPLPEEGTAERHEPIDERDIFVLPDGTTGPIVQTGGFVDAGTSLPFYHEVWIGLGTMRVAGGA